MAAVPQEEETGKRKFEPRKVKSKKPEQPVEKPVKKTKPVLADDDDSIKDFLKQLNADDGGNAMILSDNSLSINIPGVISTGSEWVDSAIGRGGLPLGRVIMLTGNEGCGKTTFCLQLSAEVQRQGGVALYIDAEYKLDQDYAVALGVNNNKLIISQPSSVEDTFGLIERAIPISRKLKSKNAGPLLIIIDSLNALPTEQENEGKDTPGSVARAVSRNLKKIVSMISKEHALLVMISQVRQKIGVSFGDDTVTAGGKAPRFYSSVILKMAPLNAIYEGIGKDKHKVGNRVKIECQKNQVSAPYKSAEVFIRYGRGVDYIHSLYEAGKTLGVINHTTGQRCTWNEHSFQGDKGLRKLITADPDLLIELRKEVRQRYGWEDGDIDAEHLDRLINRGLPGEGSEETEVEPKRRTFGSVEGEED